MAEDFLAEATKEVAQDKEEDTAVIPADVLDSWMKEERTEFEEKQCTMIYGKDGTGKSGIALDFLTDEDVKNGFKAVIIDLDGGTQPLIRYHKHKMKNLIIKNPLEEDPETYNIDYIKTFAKIKGIIHWVKKNIEKEKIKFLVFDGLSTLLKYCEYQMRLDKHIDVSGGVTTRFWLKRNKYFIEILEMIKSLPIHKFFIGHEEFIIDATDEKTASVKIKTNALVFQKLKCERYKDGTDMIFRVVIDKSKFDIGAEGKSIVFAKVDTETGEYKWKTDKIFELILGLSKSGGEKE